MDDLSAAVIHDVKNQLAELAMRLERRGDCAAETDIVLGAARRLTSLLIAQRDAAKLLVVNVDAASPAELLKELAAEYVKLFPALAISAQADDAPAFWFYDESLIRLALANAVHNACRHAQARVELKAWPSDGQLVFEVVDDGPGFPRDILDSRVPASPDGHVSTGLGLYLARRIAALHAARGRAGEVALANGAGAVFRMTLP